MKPKFTQTVEITTPGPVTLVDGLPIPGPSTVETSPARISQGAVANVGAQIELLAEQDTTISLWTILVPRGQLLTSKSTVVDDTGRKFSIVGDVADRPNHKPLFRAAAARLISDMQ